MRGPGRLNTARISLDGLLSRVAEHVQAPVRMSEPPLRGEVFSLEQLVHHAKALAETSPGRHPARRQPVARDGWVKMSRS